MQTTSNHGNLVVTKRRFLVQHCISLSDRFSHKQIPATTPQQIQEYTLFHSDWWLSEGVTDWSLGYVSFSILAIDLTIIATNHCNHSGNTHFTLATGC